MKHDRHHRYDHKSPQSHPIKDFMTPMPHAIDPHETLANADQRMAALGVTHLPVRSGGKVVGILSERDVLMLKSLPDFDAKSAIVGDVMTPDPYSIYEDVPLADVCTAMAANRYGSALIVDGAGHLLGIFTTTDALRVLAGVP